MSDLDRYSSGVFFSFADEDNRALPGEKEAWVNELARTVETLLGQEGVSHASVTTSVPGHLPLDERLQFMTSSAAVVLIASPAYWESQWLKDPRKQEALFKAAAERPANVFVVCKSDVHSSEPAQLLPLKHHFFWEPRDGSSFSLRLSDAGNNQRYYDKATDLARGIASALKVLKPVDIRAKEYDAQISRVFLAETAPELEARRAEVERYLEQAGVLVVPAGRLPRELASRKALVIRELAGCRAFVELLGADAGDASEGALLRLQAMTAREVAAANHLAIVQWRDPALKVAEVIDSSHRQLLLAETVRAESLPDFCSGVLKGVSKPRDKKAPKFLPTVFVDTLGTDMERVEQIFARYKQVEWSWGQAGQGVAKLKKQLKDWDGVLIFWGTGDSMPRQERYIFFRQRWRDLGKRPECLRIYDGPPPTKPRFQGANAPLIIGRDGQETEELRQFIDTLTKDDS
jgi:hypothetical protein